MSSNVIGVKFINFHDDRVFGDDRVGLMLEKYLGYLKCQSQSSSLLPHPWSFSDKTYHYISDVRVSPGDLVIVRGGSTMSLAIVDKVDVKAWVSKAARTVVASVNLGNEAIRQQARIKTLQNDLQREKILQKIVQRVKSCHHDQRYYLAKARKLAECDSELVSLLCQYDSFD